MAQLNQYFSTFMSPEAVNVTMVLLVAFTVVAFYRCVIAMFKK